MPMHRWRRRLGQGLAAALMVALLAAAATAAGRFVRVRVEVANIRDGPGTRYERLWTVERDFPLEVISRRGRWLKTRDFLGSEGWIYAPLTDARRAAVVEVDEARVRSGPGLRHPVRFVADWGETFHVLSRRGRWLQVQDPDLGRGWVHESLVWGP